jgi:microcystin-dependent protein
MGPFPWSRTQLPAGGWTWADGSILLPSTQFTDLRAAYIADGFPWGQDGSGNPLLPDMRGRVPAGRDDMGGTAAGRLSTTLTGTRASTANGIITGLSSTSGLCVGMAAFGTGVGTGAVIATIDSATQVTLSVVNAATGSGSIRFSIIDGNTLGAAGGSQVHKLTIEQIPSHTHTLASRADRNTASGGSDNVPVQSAGNAGFTSNARGGDQAHPNMQPTVVVNYIVKT